MSGPTASQWVSAGAGLFNGMTSMMGAFAQARALKADARAREFQGIAEANDRARAGRAAVASGAAIAGASGFTLEGSATDALAWMAQQAETNAARALWEANTEADQLRYEARVRKRAGILGFVGSAITSAATLGQGGG